MFKFHVNIFNNKGGGYNFQLLGKSIIEFGKCLYQPIDNIKLTRKFNKFQEIKNGYKPDPKWNHKF